MVKVRQMAALQESIVGRIDGVTQRLVICATAIEHFWKYRQTSPWATEAGGQLFGTIQSEFIRVESATGPYRGDERSRSRYRSNPTAAQRAIDEKTGVKQFYLGEWHTHAEDHPDPSVLDEEAMRLIIAKSRLSCNALLMVIVGRSRSPNGLCAWTISANQSQHWELGLALPL
jgi:integrative and conjugative element protein (TIGR02256 family)